MAVPATAASEPAKIDALATSLRALFDEAKGARRLYEEEWLKDLRQFLGVYEPKVEQALDPNRSHAFIRITRTKVKANDARLKDMMFPAGGDKNWAIKPTPSPTEVEDVIKVVASNITSLIKTEGQEESQEDAGVAGPGAAPQGAMPQGMPGQAPQGAPPVAPASGPSWLQWLKQLVKGKDKAGEIEDQLAEEAMEDARQRCRRMERVIESQLIECQYPELCGETIHSGNLHGTGIMKGPLVEVRNIGHWKVADGIADYQSRQDTHPYLEHTSLWDLYPDMLARRRSECEFFFERHVMLKQDLRKLAKRKDFNGDIINQYIAQMPEGDAEPLWFESEIRAINQKENSVAQKRRYEVLEYWGYLDGADLARYGVELPEGASPDVEFAANVWILGNRVIKAVLNPFDAGLIPYHFFYFDRDETGIFGVGIAKIMRDIQAVFNAAVRAAIDNSSISAGPMFEIMIDLLAPGEDQNTIAPFRTWLRKSTQHAQQAVRAISIPNNSDKLIELAQLMKQWGDEATTIPSYTHGEQDKGVSRTVGGLSMLMGAANITLKDTVRNFDVVTEGVLTGFYHWNMQFNPDPSIKGDYEIQATGTTSLVAKEMRAQQLEAYANATANPVDGVYVKRRELNRERLLALDMDPDLFLYTEDEVEQNMAKNAASQPPSAEMLRYDIDKMRLQFDAFIADQKHALEVREQEFKEHEAALVTAGQNLAKIVEQLRITA